MPYGGSKFGSDNLWMGKKKKREREIKKAVSCISSARIFHVPRRQIHFLKWIIPCQNRCLQPRGDGDEQLDIVKESLLLSPDD